VAIGERSFFSSSFLAGTLVELSKRREAGRTARTCDALRNNRAAEAVVRNEDIFSRISSGMRTGIGQAPWIRCVLFELLQELQAWIGEAIQFVTVLARCGSPTTRHLIGQSGTTAQQPAADEDLAFSRKSRSHL
jgi:hypothetical protein